LSAAIERLNLAHEQSFLRNVGRKALRRSLRKNRTKPRSEEVALAADDVVAAIKEKAPASADKTAPITPPNSTAPHRTKLAKPQPRWHVIRRLTKRWQSAVGRTG
jgi:hypothetical protein